MDSGVIKKTVDEIETLVKDNKKSVAAAAIAYFLSKDNKERNALIAGLLAYTFLGKEEE